MGLRSSVSLLLLLPLAALLGCGASNSSSGSSGPNPYDLSGNWYAVTTNPSIVTGQFSGPLQFSNGTVTGTINPMTLIPNIGFGGGYIYCPASPQPAAVTGTIDASGDLTLSVPLGGSSGTATITATIPADPQTTVTGSYEITGGACATPATPITIAQYAPVTGTYTGTLNIYSNGVAVPGESTTATAVLTQSTMPTGSGTYPLSGTFTATGTCNVSFTVVGEVAGDGVAFADFVPPSFTGSINPTATALAGSLLDSNCSGPLYSGVLTRQ